MDNFLKILSSYFYKVFFVLNQKPLENIYVSNLVLGRKLYLILWNYKNETLAM